MALDYSPTVRRRRLAAELRRLREFSGMKLEDVAAYLDCRHPKISRIEKGRGAVSVGDVRLMLDFYGVTGVEADRLIQLARDSGKKSWWPPVVTGLAGSWAGVPAAHPPAPNALA